MIRLTLGAAALIAACAVATMASAQGGAPAAPYTPRPVNRPFSPAVVREVKPGVFMLIGNGGNVAVRATPEGVILVDTMLSGDLIYQDLLQKVRSISDKPIKYVFVTHVHNDHSGNTPQFEAAGVPVIAADGYKAQVTTYTLRAGQTRSPAPTVSFAKTHTVRLGGATATAYAFNAGHTSGDSVVYFPDLKVVATGDNMFSGAPTVDWPNGGRLLGLRQNWAELAKLDFDTMIPGHGALPISRAEFDASRRKLDLLIERLSALVKAGTPKSELLARVKVDDLGPGWDIKNQSDEWTRPPRLDGLYLELSQ